MAEKLFGLRVIELRAELESRGLDKSGIKRDLVERLQKALEDDEVNIEQFCSNITNKKSTKKGVKPSTNLAINSVPSDGIEITEMAESSNNKLAEGKQVQHETTTAKTDSKIMQGYESDDSLPLVLDEDSCDEGDESGKTKGKSDEKNATTSEQEVQEQVPQESSSASAPPQQTTKKNQGPPDDGASTSNGQTEDKKRKRNANQRVLWIMNVPKGTTARQIKRLVAPWGDAQGVKLVVSSRFPGSNLYGYAVMASATDATNVINKLNNTEFRGRILKIETFDNHKRRKFMFDDKTKKIVDDKEKKDVAFPKRTEIEEPSRRRSNSEYRHTSHVSDRSSRSRKLSPSREQIREKPHPPNDSRGGYNSILTFDKIKEERERQRLRERERAEREESRRRREEEVRLREMQEISRRQKSEADRLQREREKLRMERDRIEREKTELLKLERDRQKIEREKLEIEKMELQRSRQRLEDDRRAVKRPVPVQFRVGESFQERKRPTNNSSNDFVMGMDYELPLSTSSPLPQKTFPSTKEFKRIPFNKHETFPEKRPPGFISERPHHVNANVNRLNPMKYENRTFENIRERESRPGPSRDTELNLHIRSTKDSRFTERNRNPPFRSMSDNRERPTTTQTKPNRDHHFSEQNSTNRWHQSGNQPKFGPKFGLNSQKTWTPKTSGWRPDPPNDRWNSSSNSSRMNQQFSGNSSTGLVCPPPPGINNFAERFDFSKSSGNRKY